MEGAKTKNIVMGVKETEIPILLYKYTPIDGNTYQRKTLRNSLATLLDYVCTQLDLTARFKAVKHGIPYPLVHSDRYQQEYISSIHNKKESSSQPGKNVLIVAGQ